MAMLRDQDLAEYRTAPIGELPVNAGDRWLVLLDGDLPVCAIPPGETLDPQAPRPAIIVAPDRLDLNAAFASDAFAEVLNVNAVVLVGEGRVTGVWDGSSLTVAGMAGPLRSLAASVLPGPSQIPLIVRSCAYHESGSVCWTPSSFASKPFPMPPCRNARQLTVHDFVW
jgi:hypothetical protein